MPEADTIYRTADTLRRWLVGREVTGVRAKVSGLPADHLVGQRVEGVEARGKHLLVRLSSGEVLHTHMRMTGSWHVYPAGTPWRRPERQASLVVEAGERLAVCFNAPVVELLPAKAELAHPSLAGLGPDVLGEPLDLAAVRARARLRPSDTPVAEVLLNQRVVAGVGNIYRSEALFLAGIDPETPLGDLDDATFENVVAHAARVMRANLAPAGPERDVGEGHDRRWVYARTGRPCRRCGTAVRSGRIGESARTVYWCPSCQPRLGAESASDG